jgi:hypothetical protein
LQFCGTNAHHQNGIAKRLIRTVSNMAQAMILHAASHWKGGIDSSLWLMTVTYSTYVYNHTPNNHSLCPVDLYNGSTMPCHILQDWHTRGCPVYILDPTLQSGQRLPQWQPCLCPGIFVGLSSTHSSKVLLVLNLQTGSIIMQYHVIFDDGFTTVESIGVDKDPVNHSEELCLQNTMYIHNNSTAEAPLHLQDNWLTPLEQEHKQQDLQRQHHICISFTPTSTQTIMTPAHLPKVNDTVNSEGASTPTFIQGPSPTIIPPYVPAVTIQPTLLTLQLPTPHCSECTNKGQYTQTKYSDEVYCYMVDPTQNRNVYEQQLAYTA